MFMAVELEKLSVSLCINFLLFSSTKTIDKADVISQQVNRYYYTYYVIDWSFNFWSLISSGIYYKINIVILIYVVNSKSVYRLNKIDIYCASILAWYTILVYMQVCTVSLFCNHLHLLQWASCIKHMKILPVFCIYTICTKWPYDLCCYLVLWKILYINCKIHW